MTARLYAIELMRSEEDFHTTFNQSIVPTIFEALAKLNMTTEETFASSEQTFVEELRKRFTAIFGEYFKVQFAGKYHEATELYDARYDLVLVIGSLETGTYPIRLGMFNKVPKLPVLH